MQHWPADISFWRIMKQPLHMQSNRVYRRGPRVVTSRGRDPSMSSSETQVMSQLTVKNIIGPCGGTYEDRLKVFHAFRHLLEDSQHIKLDFDGMKVASASFFNGVIGTLLPQYDYDPSKLPVSFHNFSRNHQFVFDRTVASIARHDEILREQDTHRTGTLT